MTTKSKIFVLILITCVQLIIAQVPGFGTCKAVNIMQNLDATRYLGLWYEVRKYPFIFTLGGKCVTANYGLNDDGTISVLNKQIQFGKENSITGSAKFVKPPIASLTVTFPSVPFNQEGNYNVLYTDYDDFAVVYNCNSFLGLINTKYVWILSRTRHPSQRVIEKAYEVLKDNDVSTNFISETDQNNCPEELHFNSIQNFRN